MFVVPVWIELEYHPEADDLFESRKAPKEVIAWKRICERSRNAEVRGNAYLLVVLLLDIPDGDDAESVIEHFEDLYAWEIEDVYPGDHEVFEKVCVEIDERVAEEDENRDVDLDEEEEDE